ncbi:hypothetical protein GGS26DRAFT_330282 [Hypomontagnella submonticulosa]|nr:hypothetical protein GGS26DRAFT_330282 [Hypomontagnella submonticulosa]
MDQVICSCKRCAQRLGEFANLWIKIGKSYISPIIDDEDGLAIALTGSVRLGEEQTLVDHCHLRDVACVNCHAVVGLRCLDTPVNHVLHENQLFLRLSSVAITRWDGEPVEIAIQRTLKLKEASNSRPTATQTSAPSEGDTHAYMDYEGPSEMHGQLLDHMQAQLDAQREEIQRLNRSGYQLVSSFDNAVLRIEGEIKKLKDNITGLQEDLGDSQTRTSSVQTGLTSLGSELSEVKKVLRNGSTYDHLEQELNLAKQTISDLRSSLSRDLDKSVKQQQEKHNSITSGLDRAQQDLSRMREEFDETKKVTREGVSTAKAYAKEVVSLRAELKELQEEVAQERARKSQPKDPVFPSQELDILTTSITKIGQRASHVETLQMELELLKGRVQRMENTRTSDIQGQDITDTGTQYRNSSKLPTKASKKRKHGPLPAEVTRSDTSPASSPRKRPTRISSSSTPSKNHDAVSPRPSVQVEKVGAKASNSPRLTKSGTVDKRSLRRGSRREGTG